MLKQFVFNEIIKKLDACFLKPKKIIIPKPILIVQLQR